MEETEIETDEKEEIQRFRIKGWREKQRNEKRKEKLKRQRKIEWKRKNDKFAPRKNEGDR
jgi:hypothetical protein